MDGVELMLFGMGLVFLFLVLLIFCIRGMSFVLERIAPDESNVATAVPTAVQRAGAQAVDADTLHAIQIAIKQHRARRG
jgi:oxaloacetate decarboxylase gamma subunit